MFRPDEFRPGMPLSAASMQAIVEELVRQGKISAAAPIRVSDTPAGYAFSSDLPIPLWIKLTSGGTGGLYAWTAQIATSGGGWSNDPSGASGTTSNDPATEVNGNTTVDLSPNPVVRAWRDAGSTTLFFQSGNC